MALRNKQMTDLAKNIRDVEKLSAFVYEKKNEIFKLPPKSLVQLIRMFNIGV